MDAHGSKPVKSKSHKRNRRTTPSKKLNKGDNAAPAVGWGPSFQVDQGDQDWSGWEDPLPNPEHSKGWQYQTRVDRLQDIIPFWRDGVHAALEGREVPRTEDFLNHVYSEDVWGMSADSWGVKQDDPWAAGNGWGDGAGSDGKINGDSRNGDTGEANNNKWKNMSVRQGDGGWGDNSGWGKAAEDGWGSSPKDDLAGWGVEQAPDDVPPTADEWEFAARARKHGSDKTRVQSEDVPRALEGADHNSFIDQVARLEHANGQKKAQMQRFYSVSGTYRTSLSNFY